MQGNCGTRSICTVLSDHENHPQDSVNATGGRKTVLLYYTCYMRFGIIYRPHHPLHPEAHMLPHLRYVSKRNTLPSKTR